MKVKVGQIWGNRENGAVIIYKVQGKPKLMLGHKIEVIYSTDAQPQPMTEKEMAKHLKEWGYKKIGQIPELLK